MALSSQHIEHFFREGYVLVPRLVDDSVIEQVRERAMHQVERENLYWQAQVFERANPLLNDPHLHQIF